MSVKRRVALLIEMSPTYVRELAQGVAQYNHEHGNWIIHLQRHGPDAPPPKWLRTWKGDGILVRTANPRTARAVVATGLPAVAFRWAISTSGLPTIGPDNRAVAEMAATHLRERGFRSFACLGFSVGTYPELDERMSAFGDILNAQGFACEVFHAQQHRSEESQQTQITRWLKSLPKPLGLMACNDACGLWTLNACAWAEIKVPDEVAVVGVSNDDCLCTLAHPPLSSIDLAPRSIGYEAAASLDRLMSGETLPALQILVPPRGVVTRPSTDVIATNDPAVSRAVAFIRDHACDNIQIAAVLRHVNLSRSALEPRLKRTIGRTIHGEIQRVQIERVKELLTSTDLPIKQVAQKTGFRYLPYLTRVFRAVTGQTPARYRKHVRR